MRILLVDNYDSFTFNLCQILAEHGAVTVVPNDRAQAETVAAVGAEAVVISPGPGRADRASDVAGSRDVLAAAWGRVPILGVCMGHQLLGVRTGARLVPAPEVRHGKVSRVEHRSDDELFHRVPPVFDVMRYHSWCLEAVEDAWRVLARSKPDRVVMAMRHRQVAALGVQFHPESIGTPWGRQILSNFLAEAKARGVTKSAVLQRGTHGSIGPHRG
jgi:anthranilate synthase/aminodeoxychorismate synthase-like glutamine amidotransferase